MNEVTATKIAMTHHANTERSDRLVFIAEHIGWGNVMYKVKEEERHSSLHLTSTGVILVKSWDESTLITAYPATISQAAAIFYKLGMSRIPHGMMERIRKNEIIMRKFNRK